MATTPTIATTVNAVAEQRTPVVRSWAIADYWALTKPEVNFLILIATGAGFYFGCPSNSDRFPWQSAFPAVALIPLSLTPTLLGHADRAYLIGALLLSSGFVWCATRLAVRRSNATARRLLLASIIYLPALLGLMMAEKAWLALSMLGAALP